MRIERLRKLYFLVLKFDEEWKVMKKCDWAKGHYLMVITVQNLARSLFHLCDLCVIVLPFDVRKTLVI